MSAHVAPKIFTCVACWEDEPDPYGVTRPTHATRHDGTRIPVQRSEHTCHRRPLRQVVTL